MTAAFASHFGPRYWLRLGREADRCKSDVPGEKVRRWLNE